MWPFKREEPHPEPKAPEGCLVFQQGGGDIEISHHGSREAALAALDARLKKAGTRTTIKVEIS